MNYLVWMMRAYRWVRHPPSAGRVALVLGVVALCLALAGAELLFGWPDWLTTQGGARPAAPRF